MVIVTEKNAPRAALERVLEEVGSLGFTPHIGQGESRTLVGATGPAPNYKAWLRERERSFEAVN